ncbi:hypothetical protein BJY24_005872 [Nocardia transvalensis]|uniref:Uncharacterized protein n=1 Tax=Nocardia transvalensis TaxID=37333 RepID=A0A7W9PJ99_9NOCA|nr:hypothetical protein [Nocardia transvalensis]
MIYPAVQQYSGRCVVNGNKDDGVVERAGESW